MRSVVRSQEFRRVEALPRRAWSDYADQAVPILTTAFKTPHGTQTLRPHQAAAIIEAHDQRGLFGPLGVGSGKTLITQLIPLALESKRPLLLLPSHLKKTTELYVLPKLREHWQTNPALRIESYSALSVISGLQLLEDYQPDLIMCDEVHALSHRTSARTKRFFRYLAAHPETIVVGLSGTVCKKSIQDYANLVIAALGDRAPVPKSYHDVVDWSLAIDVDVPDHERIAPGALSRFCAEGEEPIDGYSRRLVETPGVVATTTSSVDMSLTIIRVTEKDIRVPAAVTKALADLRTAWVTPGGEEITDAMDYWRKSNELAMGYYYVWAWPNAVVDYDWLRARSAWRSFVRHAIAHRRSAGGVPIDTELGVHNACAAGRLDSVGVWETWQEFVKRPQPPTVAVWYDNTLVEQIPKLITEPDTLIWYHGRALGQKLAEVGGWPCFDAGEKSALDLLSHVDNTLAPCVCSIRSHGTGKNLQRYANNLVVTCPSSGDVWEQLLGRTHRPGQGADEVFVRVLQHTTELSEQFDKACKRAEYIERSMRQVQKLSYANIA